LLSPMGQGDQLAGLYQAAVVLARTPVFMAQSLILVLFSYVAGTKHPAQPDRRDASGYLQVALRVWSMLLLPGGLALVLAPRAALALFFPTYYQAAALALQIASIGGLLLALITLLNGVFQAAGDNRHPAISALLAMITQVTILVWLVPRWGTMAAALSLLIAGVVALIVVLPAFKFHPTPRPLGRWQPSSRWRDVRSNLAQVGLPLGALIAPLALLPDGGRGLALLKLTTAGLFYLVALAGVYFRSMGGMSRLLARMLTHSKNRDGRTVTMDTSLYTKSAERRPSRSPSVYVVIPTFNEADNLPPLVAELFALPIPNLYVVVADDNSPDGTGQVAEQLRLRYQPRLNVIHRPGKGGLGPAYQHGFQHALELGADYIVQMDADFSHSPTYIPQFLQQASHYDVIVGSRYMDGSQIDPHWSWWRYALSLWANSIYVRLILGLTVRDATGGFKFWSRQALSTLMSFPVTSTGYVFQVEMAYLAQRLGMRVLEVPIYFADRRAGFSKMSSGIKLEAVWRTWYLRWRYRAVRSTPSALAQDTQPIAEITQ
jgi:dolichol-phosphate mannosyltransferase